MAAQDPHPVKDVALVSLNCLDDAQLVARKIHLQKRIQILQFQLDQVLRLEYKRQVQAELNETPIILRRVPRVFIHRGRDYPGKEQQQEQQEQQEQQLEQQQQQQLQQALEQTNGTFDPYLAMKSIKLSERRIYRSYRLLGCLEASLMNFTQMEEMLLHYIHQR